MSDRPALNTFGNLEESMVALRRHRPLALHSPHWRKANPKGSYQEWRELVRTAITDSLCLLPLNGEAAASSRVISTHDGIITEEVSLNTTPFTRIKGYFLKPEGHTEPLPAVLLLHAWGGPILFGKERVVKLDKDHPILEEHRDTYYSGKFLANEIAKAGFAVLVMDNFMFGERFVRGYEDIPETIDPYAMKLGAHRQFQGHVRTACHAGLKHLMWAGTTWPGLNIHEDQAALSYLASRPDVDAERMGCTGLSGGGWRTNLLAALDERIKASVSVGWMTTGDGLQGYNMGGAVGTFCLIPGLWNQIDLPDLAGITAPRAAMVISGQQDKLFQPSAQREAGDQIQAIYDWAGAPLQCHLSYPDIEHCYDTQCQALAIDWFKSHLGQ